MQPFVNRLPMLGCGEENDLFPGSKSPVHEDAETVRARLHRVE
jgi:hypothetical protein